MKLEKKDKLKHTIEELGFREEKDYNGKMVLKNNISIKKTMTFKEVEGLINRLKTSKQTQRKTSDISKETSKVTLGESRQLRCWFTMIFVTNWFNSSSNSCVLVILR